MKTLLACVFALFFTACSVMTTTQSSLPHNEDESVKITLSVFALENYTDTPQAGMRASNIAEGVLLTKGFNVINHISTTPEDFQKKLSFAKHDKSQYMLMGGVSEWRYKTGIDGEPAISLQMRLVETNSSKTIWSSTASDNSWGNASIGTVAHSLIESMLSH